MAADRSRLSQPVRLARRPGLRVGPAWAASLAALSGWACPAAADVATDGALGRRTRLTGPAVEVGAHLGQTRGKNLFHSFERFGVEADGRVTFTGPSGLDNVISRVTGGEASRIDGTLASTVPGADVYLINPSGIVFGPGGRLEVPGSFHASTADELRLSDGAAFSATNPGATVLSVARPEAFGFLGGGRPAAIEVQSEFLGVDEGRTLTLAGGDVAVDSGPGGGVVAPAGTITVAGFGGPGSLAVERGTAAGDVGGDVVIAAGTTLTTRGDGGGAIRVRGGRLTLQAGSSVFADNDGATDATGGVDIAVRDATLLPGAQITSDTLAPGDAGTVVLRASGSLVLQGGRTFVGSTTFGDGDAGSVTVEAGRVAVVGRGSPASDARITSDAGTNVGGPASTGNAGDVRVTADVVELRNAGVIASTTFKDGRAGIVTVDAGRLVVVGNGGRDLTGVTSQTNAGSTGEAGNVQVTAREIEIRNGGVVSSNTSGPGRAGSVAVDAGRMFIDGEGAPLFTGVQSRAAEGASGDGGSVTVRADSIELRDRGEISSGTLAGGDAGGVSVTAGRILIVGNPADAGLGGSFFTSIDSRAEQGATGNAGSVLVTAGDIELRSGGALESSSRGRGRAGDVTVSAGRLRIEEGGLVASSNTGDGPAGDVLVQTTRIDVDGGGIRTEGNNAEGGRIEVRAGDLILLDEADVSSNGILPQEGASLITLRAPTIVLNDSRVTSLTGDGTPLAGSGEARVLGDVTLISDDSLVAGSSTVELAGVDNTVGTGLQLSPGAFLDAGALLGQTCAARRVGKASTFARAGRGGLPPSPDRPLASAGTAERERSASAEGGRLVVAGTALAAECDGRPLAGAM